jgi:hypothetical protein
MVKFRLSGKLKVTDSQFLFKWIYFDCWGMHTHVHIHISKVFKVMNHGFISTKCLEQRRISWRVSQYELIRIMNKEIKIFKVFYVHRSLKFLQNGLVICIIYPTIVTAKGNNYWRCNWISRIKLSSSVTRIGLENWENVAEVNHFLFRKTLHIHTNAPKGIYFSKLLIIW